MIEDRALETERLALRPHGAGDWKDCRALWTDARITRLIGGAPLSEEEVWTKLLRYAGHWSLLGFGYWAVHERATWRFVGEVGFGDFHRDVQPLLDVPEMGWVLAPWAHGRGLATEAARAALAWGDGRGWRRTVCLIHPDNHPSRRVAAKLGYRECGSTTYKGSPALWFERVR